MPQLCWKHSEATTQLAPSVVPNRNARAIVQVEVRHDVGTRAVVGDLVNLDKLGLVVAQGEVVLAEGGGHDRVGAAAGAGRRPLEGHAGDGARVRVQVPGRHMARVRVAGAGRGEEVLGGRRGPARDHDLGGRVVGAVCVACVFGYVC